MHVGELHRKRESVDAIRNEEEMIRVEVRPLEWIMGIEQYH